MKTKLPIKSDQGEMNGAATFGAVIRGLRYGYGPAHCGFLRIERGPPHKIEVLPATTRDFPKHDSKHVVWWDAKDGENRIDPRTILPLANINKIKMPVQFYVDDEGRMVR